MEKLLEAFASGLLIRVSSEMKEAVNKPANEEQKAVFKEVLRKHLDSVGERRKLDDVVTYDFHLGRIRGERRDQHEEFIESYNGNLAEVILRLPELPEGESYVFPTPTSVSFKIVAKDWKKAKYMPIKVCFWIQQRI